MGIVLQIKIFGTCGFSFKTAYLLLTWQTIKRGTRVPSALFFGGNSKINLIEKFGSVVLVYSYKRDIFADWNTWDLVSASEQHTYTDLADDQKESKVFPILRLSRAEYHNKFDRKISFSRTCVSNNYRDIFADYDIWDMGSFGSGTAYLYWLGRRTKEVKVFLSPSSAFREEYHNKFDRKIGFSRTSYMGHFRGLRYIDR